MAKRLTKKISKTTQDKYSLGSYLYYDFAEIDDTNKLLNKLGKLEDILERYGIESLEELECLIEQTPKFGVKENVEKCGQEINGVFFSNEQMLILSQYDELQEPYKKRYEQVKSDRDTWKRTCELACDYMCKFVIPCPDIHRKECESFCDLNKADCYKDYFYQQAKEEKNII